MKVRMVVEIEFRKDSQFIGTAREEAIRHVDRALFVSTCGSKVVSTRIYNAEVIREEDAGS